MMAPLQKRRTAALEVNLQKKNQKNRTLNGTPYNMGLQKGPNKYCALVVELAFYKAISTLASVCVRSEDREIFRRRPIFLESNGFL